MYENTPKTIMSQNMKLKVYVAIQKSKNLKYDKIHFN